MLELPQVTLCAVDTAHPALALRAINRSMRGCRFAAATLITDRELDAPGVELVRIEPLRSRDEYSQFVLKELIAHVRTPYVLLIQWDGFVVNPVAWQAAFLECDYIGAKWYWHDDAMRVGNGGFSLRSMKLLQALQDPRIQFVEAEDVTICRAYRPLLEAEYGIRFASESLADAFAFEASYPVGAPFGFHGVFNFWRVMSQTELVHFSQELDTRISRLPQFMQLGLNCLAIGWWDAARAIFETILRDDPANAAARARLADTQRGARTPELIARNALCACGSGLRYKHCHGAVASDSAADSSTRRTMRPPLDAPRLIAWAREALTRGDSEGARETSQRVVDTEPANALAWDVLGLALQDGNTSLAEDAFRRAIDLAPANADAQFHLGNLLRRRTRYDEAIGLYRRVLAVVPTQASVRNNLALALEQSGRTDEALDEYRRVLAREPAHRQALSNIAHLLCRLQRYDEADACCARFVETFPDADATIWVDYAICRQHAGDVHGAARALESALALSPDDALVLANLGSLESDRGDFARAAALLARAEHADPSFLYAKALGAYCRQQLCDWERLPATHRAIVAEVRSRDDDWAVPPFAFLSLDASADDQQRVARRWAKGLTAPTAIRAARHADDRVRLAYLSSDFGTHSTAFLMTEVWERHDRARVETYAYSLSPREPSALGERIGRAFDRFQDCSAESAQRTAERIRDDGIDILIDLNGYTRGARSAIAMLKPARMQASWLGYLGTMGSPAIDFIVTDRYLTPEHARPNFDEAFLHLPRCYCPSDTRRADRDVSLPRDACELPPGAFVFACFNEAYKILPHMFDAWMRILSAVPGSVLWLAPTAAAATERLREHARARDIDAARLVFASRVPLDAHLARYEHVDLALDTAPYGAGTVANDALWCGVPMLTVAGATMAGRMAASQLHAIGMDELIADDLRDYEARAIAMAQNRAALSRSRDALRAGAAEAGLFDMQRFTAELERALIDALRSIDMRGDSL